MKKRILSLLLVLLMVGTLVPTAAFADDTGVAVDRINFPDDTFRAYVSESCDMDDNGYLSDVEISSVKGIDVGGRGIASLEGICYFTELQFLSCDNNKLTSLPELPSGLTELSCVDNQLTELPELPSGLNDLWCDSNQLTSLPELPSGLTELGCGGNQLMSLPGLPSGLTVLCCDGNQLMSLPGLPSGLTVLYCDGNQLTSLPELPSGLTRLDCSHNQLTSLPGLPSDLTELGCGGNQLTEIKLNPLAEYTYINVSDNCLPNKEAVTGQYIDWNEQNFIFGEQKHAHEHVTELVGAKAATCTEDGYTGDEVCSICGEVISQGETIPATGHHFKGNTCPDCGETRSTADTIRAWFQDTISTVKNLLDKLFGKN